MYILYIGQTPSFYGIPTFFRSERARLRTRPDHIDNPQSFPFPNAYIQLVNSYWLNEKDLFAF